MYYILIGLLILMHFQKLREDNWKNIVIRTYHQHLPHEDPLKIQLYCLSLP